MCTLYAGIYRVALRLQRAAEARRSRMAESLVSVASHAVTHIGLGMSCGPAAVPLAAPATRFPDRTDSSDGPTAVTAELHSKNVGEDQLKPTSPESFVSERTSNSEYGHEAEAREDCHNGTTTVTRRLEIATDRAKQQTEVTPLLKHSVDNDRRALNNSDVASTSGVDGSRLPLRRMTSKCRRRWLIVLPGDDDKAGESWARSAGVNGRRHEKTAARRSVDAGRPHVRVRTRYTRRSLFELPTYADISTASVLAGRSTSSSSSDECGCESRHNDHAEIVSAADELANAVNNVIDVATTCVQVDCHCSRCSLSLEEHPQNQSVGFDCLSADKSQPTIEAATTTTTTTSTSLFEKCDHPGADRRCAREIMRPVRNKQQQQQQQQQPKKNEENAEKNDDVVVAEKSVKEMADRWRLRRMARSQFTANRRFAHLRHWKLQRRSAGQTPTSSSIDDRQIPVSRPLLLSSFASAISVTKLFFVSVSFGLIEADHFRWFSYR